MCMEDVRIARNAKAQRTYTDADRLALLPGLGQNSNRYSVTAYILVVPTTDTQVLLHTIVGGRVWPLAMLNSHNQSVILTIDDVGDALLGPLFLSSMGGDGPLDTAMAETFFQVADPGAK